MPVDLRDIVTRQSVVLTFLVEGESAMRVAVLYFDGCPNHAPTVERVKQIVAGLGVQERVEEIEVTSLDQAQQLRFLGSPTVRVDGVDIDPSARQRTNYGLSCRVYSGVFGLPPDDLIMAALQSPLASA
jgi:hypothetical protein